MEDCDTVVLSIKPYRRVLFGRMSVVGVFWKTNSSQGLDLCHPHRGQNIEGNMVAEYLFLERTNWIQGDDEPAGVVSEQSVSGAIPEVETVMATIHVHPASR